MQQERESAELCVNGCGFFGAPGSGGMCSVCWKKTMSNKAVESSAPSPRAETKVELVASASSEGAAMAAVSPAVAVAVPAVDNNSASAASAEPAAPAVEEKEAAPKVAAAAEEKKPAEKLVQKNKKRCWECKKKVGLTAIECRCGYVFCSNHRYADQHACSFDFKAADRAELARRNPGGGQFGKLEKL